MRRIILPLITGAAVVGIAACSPDEQDFKKEAEKYIEGDDVEKELGENVNDVECEEPVNKEVGTTYTCVGTGDSGTPYTFTVEITGDRELTVTGAVPGGGATTGSVAPIDTSAVAPIDTSAAAPTTTAAG